MVPANILAAAETFLSQSPLTGILTRLPRFIQTGIAIVTIILLIWATAHLCFLVAYFCKKIKHGFRNSFRTTFAPTLQLQKLTEARIIQNSVITSLQQKICENELAHSEFKENVINRLEQLENRDVHV